MTLSEKKVYILRLIPLGVDFFSACIDARCTDTEITALEDDESFQTEVKFCGNREKIALIEKYKKVAQSAATINLDYRAIRSLLMDFFPEAIVSQGGKSDEERLVINIPSNGRK